MRRVLFRALSLLTVTLLVGSCSENAADIAAPGTAQRVNVAPQMDVIGGGSVVISQVYGGGGNANATYTNDFVELFNRSAAPVDISSWSVQYASSSGTTWQVTSIPASTILQPGHYYLIQEASGGAVGVALPTADRIGTINMSATDGKVALSRTATALNSTAPSCPATPDVVDHVGFGSTDCSGAWGAIAKTSSILSAQRGAQGCTATGGNANDFANATPLPRNSATTAHTCDIVTSVPDSVGVAPPTATIEAGQTLAFTATAVDAAKQPVGTTYTWSSSDTDVATVSATGVVTGVATGTAVITATSANSISGNASVTVISAPADPDVAISQIYGGGGNTGAPYTNDFVELFNRGSSAVAIGGWSVQYGASAGTTWQVAAIPANVTLAPGQYYLVQLSSGGAVGLALPTADATGSINMSGTTGKVVLSRTTAALSGACPADGNVVNRVNFGGANCATAWTNAPAPSNTNAVLRAGSGCTYTADASADFSATAPTPRNRAAAFQPCHAAPGDPASVTISPSTASVLVGGTVTLSASALDASHQAATTTFTWTTTDPAIATVDAGVVTGVAVGSAGIIATSTNGVADTATITVSAAAPPSSGIIITEILANPAGDETVREWFEVFNSGTSDVDMQGWEIRSAKSTGPDEVHVIASSVVVPAGGFAVFGNSANTTLNDNVPVSYVFPNSEITLSNGSNTEWLALHTAVGVTADSVAYSPRTAGGVVTNPTYLPVEGIAREVIDIAQDNSAMSSSNWRDATVPYGTGSNFGTPGYGAYGVAGPIVRLVIAPSPASVLENGTRAMTATAVDALGRVSTASLTWSSSDPAIASIDNNGVASGHAPGSVTITARAASGVQAQTTLVVVDPDAPATITLSTDLGLEPVGTESRLITSVKTVDGRSVFVPLTYTVSDPNVLAIDNFNGRMYLRGVGPGTAEVRATATNGVFGTRTETVVSAVAPTTAVYRNHIEFGMPTDGNASDDIIVTHNGYISSYNASRGGPNWVSWDLNASSFGPESRCNCFSPDQSLPSGVYKVNDTDYINSNYDRGHMVQSDSRSSTLQENAPTFYMTNILPQAAANNQQVWGAFENYLDTLAVHGNEVYTVAGGEYAAVPQTLNDSGRVAIPDYTWKIALIMPGGQGLANVTSAQSMQVIAVRMPNLLTTATGGTNWQQYQTTVDAIEAATHYDFLSALPDDIERVVESGDRAPVAGITGTYSGVEGTPIQFNGVATDPDEGDGTTLTWAFGDGGVATGSAPTHTYESAGTYTVVFIATDSYGVADTATTAVTVAPSPPPTASFTAPPTVSEGTSIALALTNLVDANVPTLTFAFDCGAGYGAFGGTATITCATTDDAALVVKAKVRNQRGKESEYSASVIVTNVAPTVAPILGATILAGESYNRNGSFTDAGADTWTGSVDFGTGAAPLALSGQSFTLANTYGTAGTFTVTVVIADDDGGAGTATATVIVQSPSEASEALRASIAALQANGDVPAGTASTLTKTLADATQKLAAKDNPSGINKMETFKNQVDAAVKAGKITAAVGASLKGMADRIIASAQR